MAVKKKHKVKKRAAPRIKKSKPLPPLAPGQKNDPPPDPAYYRERGQVADFIRCNGKLWRYQGPNPLEPGCLVRAKVLEEFATQLEQVRKKLAEPEIYIPGAG